MPREGANYEAFIAAGYPYDKLVCRVPVNFYDFKYKMYDKRDGAQGLSLRLGSGKRHSSARKLNSYTGQGTMIITDRHFIYFPESGRSRVMWSSGEDPEHLFFHRDTLCFVDLQNKTIRLHENLTESGLFGSRYFKGTFQVLDGFEHMVNMLEIIPPLDQTWVQYYIKERPESYYTERYPQETPMQGSSFCPDCGKELMYVEQYQRYYCRKCSQYHGYM